MARTAKTAGQPSQPRVLIRSRHFLRAWREERELTQPQLAERLNVGHDRISKWENGGPLTEAKLYALTDALRLKNVGDLFRDPSDQDGVWAIANRIAALKPGSRKVLLDALTGIERGDSEENDDAA